MPSRAARHGAARVHVEPCAEGRVVGKKRITRLMRTVGIVGASRRHGIVTTQRNSDARPAPDLVDATSRPIARTNSGSLTSPYVPTAEAVEVAHRG